MTWTFADIPDQSGRIAIVTGANSGIGEPTARELARAGSSVILACRNPEKAEAALDRIRRAVPDADLRFMPLDLSDLSTVHEFADRFQSEHERLDLLINNAGVMVPPYSKTKDGFELQIGTNHLGHFALTGRLMGLLLTTPESRVVSVSSNAHKMGKVRFDDLHYEKRYSRWGAYCQSKVANLLFCYELQRRLSATGASCSSVAAHPGWTHTNLFAQSWTAQVTGSYIAMDPDAGAAPTLRAATEPEAEGGSYYGPGGFLEIWGSAVRVKSNRYSQREDVAARLWSVSQDLTSVRFMS